MIFWFKHLAAGGELHRVDEVRGAFLLFFCFFHVLLSHVFGWICGQIVSFSDAFDQTLVLYRYHAGETSRKIHRLTLMHHKLAAFQT